MNTSTVHCIHSLSYLCPLQIADFGFSKEVEQDRFLETYCGSPLYASPEMILGRPYFGSECDVWSLGVILYTMLTATMPFDDRNIPTFLACIEKGIYPEPADVSESKYVMSDTFSSSFSYSANWLL